MTSNEDKIAGDQNKASGRYEQARLCYEKTVAGLRGKKENGTQLANALIALAATDKELCLHEQALLVAQEALSICGRTTPPQPELKAEVLTQLGSILTKLKRFEEAEDAFEESLTLKRQNFSGPISIATTLNEYGMAKLDQDQASAAEPMLSQALGIFERASNQDGGYAQTLNILSVLHSKAQNYTLAEPLCKRALAIRRRELGTHLSVAESLHNLGVQHLKRGQAGKAEPLWREALEIKEQFLPAAHPGIILTLNHLSSACLAGRKFAEAESLYKRSLELQEGTTNGDEHALANAVAGLGLTYLQQGKFNEAEPYIKRSLSFLDDQGVPNALEEKGLLDELFTCYVFQGKFGDALRLVPDTLRAKHTSEFNNFVDLVGQLGNLASKLFEPKHDNK